MPTDGTPVARGFYRSRAVVTAIQFTGENAGAVTDFLGGPYDEGHGWNKDTATGGMVRTLDGVCEFVPGDWIVREVNAFAVYHPSHFEELYEDANA
jgi:hypothetical protein